VGAEGVVARGQSDQRFVMRLWEGRLQVIVTAGVATRRSQQVKGACLRFETGRGQFNAGAEALRFLVVYAIFLDSTADKTITASNGC
jgi:hypothetical protein